MKKILIIEDDRIMIRILQDHFADADVEFLLAPEAAEGVQKARDAHPDLVILDIALAGQSGLDVLEKLKQFPETASTPVVVFSATDQDEVVKRARSLGVVDYIVKGSLSLQETLARIKKYIK